MPAGPWVLYNDFLFNEGRKAIDLVNDTFKIALFTSASSAINRAVSGAGYTAFAADGHEVAPGTGYSTGGAAVVSSWVGGGSSATSTFDTSNPSWTASGAGFTARAAVLYSDSSAGKLAVSYCLLDATPADVTVPSGTTLQIQVNDIFVDSQG
jgi:hypothetical protein